VIYSKTNTNDNRTLCPHFLLSGHYLEMPRICKHVGCRNRPLYGMEQGCPHFCAEHKGPNMKNMTATSRVATSGLSTCIGSKCQEQQSSPRFRGYCAPCYVTLFPEDPLTFQTVYRSKQQATYQFVASRFDGFQHESPLYIAGVRIDCRIVIADTVLCVSTDPNIMLNEDGTTPYKVILIVFNPNKYVTKTCESVNPMLYMRLPLLEDEIARQMERIIANENRDKLEIIRLFATTSDCPSTNSP
jgi:hypothetical protein